MRTALSAALQVSNKTKPFLNNGNFSYNTAGWTAYNNATLSSAAGGSSGNCLCITNVGATIGLADQKVHLLKGYYLLSVKFKKGTAASGYIAVSATAGAADLIGSQVSDVAWTLHTYQFNLSAAADVYIDLWSYEAVDGKTAFFDEVKLEKYTGNLVANGSFTTDTTGWTGTATLASVAGGQAGNCLRMTGGVGTSAYFLVKSLPTGSYTISLYHKNSDAQGYFALGTTPGATDILDPGAAYNDAGWTKYNYTITRTGNLYINFWNWTSGTVGYWDEISLVKS